MTADIVAAALAGLGPMLHSRQRKPVNKFASRRQFGDALLMQGAIPRPLQGGVVEGLARALQSGLGGWMAGRAERDEIADEEGKSRSLMEAIARAQTTNPDGTTSFDFSPVAQALASSGQGGTAAYMMLMDQLARRQRGQSAVTTRMITGNPPPGGAPPVAPGSYPDRVSATESPNGATNPQSGAIGFFQFMPRTAIALAKQTPWGASLQPAQIIAEVKADPAKQRDLMTLYTRQSEGALVQAGLPVNDVTRFALHAFGPAGGVSLLKAPDNMPVAQWVQSVDWDPATPEEVIAQNNLQKYQTVGQLKQDFIARRIGGGRAQAPGAPVPQVTQGPPPAPPMGMAPPQPQMVAGGPVEGAGVDDSGQDGGMSPGFAPTVRLPPQQRLDDGSREMAVYERWLAAGAPPAQEKVALQYYEAAQKKRVAAQQAQIDAAGKEPPMMARTDQGGVALVEGALEAERAKATARAQGGGVWQPGTDPNTGAPGLVNPVTGEFKPTPAPFNEGQGRAATFADRMAASERNLRQVEGEGTSAWGALMERLGGVGNFLQSPEYQRYEQARRDFINAQLRRESGAVISPEEFANAEKQYFPRPGDSPAVIEQKRRNRQIALEGMARDAGPAYTPRESAQAGGDALQQARDAIARGAPRDKVIERLRSMGIDPGGL